MSHPEPSHLPEPVARFFAAVEARDIDELAECFTEDASYAFTVPLPPVVGRRQLLAVFDKLFNQTTRIRWEVQAAATSPTGTMVERIDRFWFDGYEARIECCGIFEIFKEKIVTVRDYADHGTWTERKARAQSGSSEWYSGA